MISFAKFAPSRLLAHAISRRMATDYIIVILGTGCTRAAAFLTSVLVARLLGKESLGNFSIFYASMILTWQLAEAFDTAFICQARRSEVHARKIQLLKASFLLKIIYSVVIMATAGCVNYFVVLRHCEAISLNNYIWNGIACGCAYSYVTSIANFFREKDNFVMFTAARGMHSSVIFAVLLFLFLFKMNFNLGNVIDLHIYVSIILGLLSCYQLYIRTDNPFHFNKDDIKQSISFGKWVFGSAGLYYISQRIDIFIIAKFISMEDVGVYAVAVQLLMIVSVMIGAMSSILLPKAIKAAESEFTFKVYVSESLIPIVSVLLLLLAIAAVAPALIHAVYGGSFVHSAHVLRILCIGWMFGVLYLPLSLIFYAMNDPRTRFFLEFSKILTCVAMMLYLVPKFGVIGGGCAVAASIMLNAVMSTLVLRQKLATWWRKERTDEALVAREKGSAA